MPLNVHFFLSAIFVTPGVAEKKKKTIGLPTTFRVRFFFLQKHNKATFFFLFLDFDTAFRRSEQDGKSAIKFEAG